MVCTMVNRPQETPPSSKHNETTFSGLQAVVAPSVCPSSILVLTTISSGGENAHK